jgi:hypothetical protein
MTLGRHEPPGSVALESRVDARWARMLVEQPDLAPVIDLQRTLIGTQLAALRAIGARGTPPVLPRSERIADHLATGRPVLSVEPPEPPALLGPLVWKFARDLANAGAGDGASHLAGLLAERRLDGGSIVARSLARDTQAFRSTAVQFGLAPDLLWLVGELAAAPYAHVCAEAVMSSEDSRVGSALLGWTRGSCPICGSRPALAEHTSGRWTLRCSFCATGWGAPGDVCVYCGSRDRLSTVADSKLPASRLVACGGCDAYLKIVAREFPLVFPLQALEDLATADLDRTAIERGLHRPALDDRPGGRPCERV